ncbi:short chain dehydrogenase [Streptomyces sp. NPDC087422]|uniref:short chain dehydrogenase n=1 Tax=Streptomyces sp. NPDC087422 TaxID=3365786 RepID=UPI0038134205
MRALLIGASGTVGSAVAAALTAARHEVVAASRRGPLKVDLEVPSTMDTLFGEVDGLDAVVCCAANGPLLELASATDEDFATGVRAKLWGQVALVQRAARHVRDGGSITLTGGTFAAPMAGGSLGALINSGLEGFVRNAASELPRGLRLNLVSPGWISETLRAMSADPAAGTPVREVAEVYVGIAEGTVRGRTFRP